MLVSFSKAMADSNRLKILTLIQREQQLCVCELCDTLKLSQPLVSRHLKQLKAVNVLESHKEGKWMIYRITSEPNPLLLSYLTQLEPLGRELGEIVGCSVR